MFAIFQGGFRQSIVGPYRRYHGNQIDVRRLENVVGIHRKSDRWMRFMQPLLALGAFVADQDDLRTLVSVKIADDVRSPISVTNHTNADHIAPWNYKWCIPWPARNSDAHSFNGLCTTR